VVQLVDALHYKVAGWIPNDVIGNLHGPTLLATLWPSGQLIL